MFNKSQAEEQYEDPDEAVDEDEDDEPEICAACNGSGEGMYDGSRCYKCKGTGVEPRKKDDDDDR